MLRGAFPIEIMRLLLVDRIPSLASSLKDGDRDRLSLFVVLRSNDEFWTTASGHPLFLKRAQIHTLAYLATYPEKIVGG